MDDNTKSESAMQLADKLIAKTPTETTDVTNENNIKENIMADTTTRNIFNATPAMGTDGLFGVGGGLGGGGLIGGLILGSLLRNGNGLFGGNGEGAAAVTQQMLSQDIGDIKAGVATSALETQKAVSASNMDINQTLFNQSAAIQQQIGGSNLAIANGLATTNQNLANAMSSIKDSFDSGLLTTNQNMASGFSSNKDAMITPSPAPIQPNSIQPPQVPQVINPLIQPDLFSIVKTAVQSELSRLGLGNNVSNNTLAATANTQLPQQQTQQLLNGLNQNPLGFVLPIIGEAFTKDQQEWLSQPQILMGIPGFLMSGDGKTILNMMLDSYKEFLDKGNESK